MSNVGSCGHKLDDLSTTISIKSYDDSQQKCIEHLTVCSSCLMRYKKEGKILETEEEGNEWLGIKSPNESQKPHLLMKVVSFRRKKSSLYEKGFYFESNSKDTNQKIIDSKGSIVKKVWDIKDDCLTQIELSMLI